jgi:hypothetical protein
MKVDAGLFQILMSKEQLNGAQVSTVFQQVGSETVSQGIVVLLMIFIQRRFVIVIIPSMAQG